MIHLGKGERSFSYWRSNAAARGLATMRPGSRRPLAALAQSSFRASRSPSFNDEQLHFAEPDQQATITHYQALGLDRIIVKNGGKRIVLSDHCAIRRIETVPVAAVVDSTSAGDSRNGAFWHDSPRLAVRWRRRITPPHVASIVTGRHGASIESTALSVLPGFNPPA